MTEAEQAVKLERRTCACDSCNSDLERDGPELVSKAAAVRWRGFQKLANVADVWDLNLRAFKLLATVAETPAQMNGS